MSQNSKRIHISVISRSCSLFLVRHRLFGDRPCKGGTLYSTQKDAVHPHNSNSSGRTCTTPARTGVKPLDTAAGGGCPAIGFGRVHCRLAVLYVCTMFGCDMDMLTAASSLAPGLSLESAPWTSVWISCVRRQEVILWQKKSCTTRANIVRKQKI